MSSQNTTHATDTLAMNTPNATNAEVVQSANVMMDMWGAENIAKVSFAAKNLLSYSFSQQICNRNYQTPMICVRFTLNFFKKSGAY